MGRFDHGISVLQIPKPAPTDRAGLGICQLTTTITLKTRPYKNLDKILSLQKLAREPDRKPL